jgi:hypothetical protein
MVIQVIISSTTWYFLKSTGEKVIFSFVSIPLLFQYRRNG